RRDGLPDLARPPPRGLRRRPPRAVCGRRAARRRDRGAGRRRPARPAAPGRRLHLRVGTGGGAAAAGRRAAARRHRGGQRRDRDRRGHPGPPGPGGGARGGTGGAGIGDTRAAAFLELTTVNIPTYELGAIAARRILAGAAEEVTILPHRLVPRATTTRRRAQSAAR